MAPGHSGTRTLRAGCAAAPLYAGGEYFGRVEPLTGGTTWVPIPQNEKKNQNFRTEPTFSKKNLYFKTISKKSIHLKLSIIFK